MIQHFFHVHNVLRPSIFLHQVPVRLYIDLFLLNLNSYLRQVFISKLTMILFELHYYYYL